MNGARRGRRARTGPGRARASRRGLTLLEVVFAVVLLGMVAVSVTSLLSLSVRLHGANMQRLGGYEVANRIILMQLDDRVNPPSQAQAISQNGYRYRFTVTEEPVTMRVKQTAATARSQGQVPMDRFRRITVRVWAVAEGFDNNYDIAGDQVAELTRVYDPMADLFRNPDSRDRLVASPEGLQLLISRFSNMAPAGGGAQQQPQQGGDRRGR